MKREELVNDSIFKLPYNIKLDIERSKLMHLAAQRNHKVRGVWKIGDDHARHLQAISSIPVEKILSRPELSDVAIPMKANYNLVHQEKFNKALEDATAYERLKSIYETFLKSTDKK